MSRLPRLAVPARSTRTRQQTKHTPRPNCSNAACAAGRAAKHMFPVGVLLSSYVHTNPTKLQVAGSLGLQEQLQSRVKKLAGTLLLLGEGEGEGGKAQVPRLRSRNSRTGGRRAAGVGRRDRYQSTTALYRR